MDTAQPSETQKTLQADILAGIIKSLLSAFDENRRKRIIDSVLDDYCEGCGREIKQSVCYCMRDE